MKLRKNSPPLFCFSYRPIQYAKHEVERIEPRRQKPRCEKMFVRVRGSTLVGNKALKTSATELERARVQGELFLWKLVLNITDSLFTSD